MSHSGRGWLYSSGNPKKDQAGIDPYDPDIVFPYPFKQPAADGAQSQKP